MNNDKHPMDDPDVDWSQGYPHPRFLGVPELPIYDENGIDLTQIREMLSLTYKQRLDMLNEPNSTSEWFKHARSHIQAGRYARCTETPQS